MTLTLSAGWWLLPTFVTVASLVAVRIWGPRMQPQNGSMFPDLGGALLEGLFYAGALVLSLICWLAWALL